MLPRYQDVAEALQQQGFQPRRIPEKRPTKKGLARYAMVCIFTDPQIEEYPYWHRLWFAAVGATDLLLDYLDVRTPADTFDGMRLQVQLRLADPAARQSDTAKKAWKWATRT